MKISEIRTYDLMEYARECNEDAEMTFRLLLTAVKSFIKGYTGLNDDELDDREDLTIVLMVLVNEMYENRTYTIDNKIISANKLVHTILNMHSKNFL